jgi:hypothetical protein
MSNALTPTAQRLAVTRAAYNAAVKTRDDEIERLRETVALMEKRIIQLQGHDHLRFIAKESDGLEPAARGPVEPPSFGNNGIPGQPPCPAVR